MSGGGPRSLRTTVLGVVLAAAAGTACPAQSTCSVDLDCPEGWVCSPVSGRCVRENASGSSGAVSNMDSSSAGASSRDSRGSTSAPSSRTASSSRSATSSSNSSVSMSMDSSSSSATSVGAGSSTSGATSAPASGSSGTGVLVLQGAFVPAGMVGAGTGVVLEGSFDVTGVVDGVTTGGVHLQGRFQ